jgi:Mce-associated membrane protein
MPNFRKHLRLPNLRARRGVVAALAAIALATAATGVGWHQDRQARQRDVAVRQSLAAAASAAQAIFSYDYRSFDTSVANARAFVTGQFAQEYAQTTTALKPNAVAEQAIVRAAVSASGVVSAAPQRVELLLYLNQYRRNTNITGEKVDQNRVVLTMVPVKGTWMVSRAIAI